MLLQVTDAESEAQRSIAAAREVSTKSDGFGLYGQVTKRTWWMPWQLKAMKDVVACDKFRGGGKQPLIRKFPNGETRPLMGVIVH